MKIEKSENNENVQIIQSFKLISSIIIILLIILQLECFLYFLLELIYQNKILTIILFIIFQYLLFHYVIESFLFLIQFPLFGKASYRSNGCIFAKELTKYLSFFIDICEKVVDNEKMVLTGEYIQILDIYERINLTIYLFYEMKKRYGLSKYQQEFYKALVTWRKHFNQFKVVQYFQDNKKYNGTSYNILFNKNLVILILDSNFLIKIADDFICNDYHFLSIKRIFTLIFNDTFGSENELKTDFSHKFKEQFNKFITKDNKVIDYAIIDAKKMTNLFGAKFSLIEKKLNQKKDDNINNDNNIDTKIEESNISTLSSIYYNNDDNNDIKYNNNKHNQIYMKKSNRKKNLIIFCNPNSMIYQCFSPDKCFFYYKGNCDILFWNYRGYGESDGFTNFDNIKSDILEIYDEIKKWNNYEKIGVHGYSIGGIPATYLAKNRNVDLLISDRNFANISNIAQSYPFGSLLKFFSKFFWIDRINNDMNYLYTKNINCIKIILCDPLDEVVLNNGSIKSNISRYLINKNNKSENILDIFLNSAEKTVFISALINIENFIEKNSEFNKNLFIVYLNRFFECFSFGSENLVDYNKFKNRRLKKLYIDNFFNNFFVWGTRISDEKNDKNIFYKTENNLNYIEKAIEILNLLHSMESNLSELNNRENILKDIKMVKNGINRIKQKMDKIKIYDKVNKGYLLRLKCGHNIILKGNEEKILVKILEKEKFFQ